MSPQALAQAAAEASVQTAPEAAPIRSQVELDAYLREHAGQVTPFDALPPGARERFFLSLGWSGRGLSSLDPTPLVDELPQPQIDAILRLFGDGITKWIPPSRLPATSAGASPSTAGISDLERRYNEFYRARLQHDLDEVSLAAVLGERFDALLADAYTPDALRTVDDRHLTLLWYAATATATMSHAPRHAAAMQGVFAERTRRSNGIPPADYLRATRDMLLSALRFDDARRLLERHPGTALGPLPAFIDTLDGDTGNGTTAWRMAADGRSLTREHLSLAGTQIFVTAGCHFSADAAEDIALDPVLGPAFARHAHWLMLPPGLEDIGAVHDWNRRFPQAPARMIHSRAEWPLFPAWRMPVFYIVRDDRIVESIPGWPRGDDSHREALIQMLQRAGLLD